MDEQKKAAIDADFFRNNFSFHEECDIYQYQDPGESLGEIRSLYMTH